MSDLVRIAEDRFSHDISRHNKLGPWCPLGPSIDCAGNHVLTAVSVSVLFPAMFRLSIVELKARGTMYLLHYQCLSCFLLCSD